MYTSWLANTGRRYAVFIGLAYLRLFYFSQCLHDIYQALLPQWLSNSHWCTQPFNQHYIPRIAQVVHTQLNSKPRPILMTRAPLNPSCQMPAHLSNDSIRPCIRLNPPCVNSWSIQVLTHVQVQYLYVCTVPPMHGIHEWSLRVLTTPSPHWHRYDVSPVCTLYPESRLLT